MAGYRVHGLALGRVQAETGYAERDGLVLLETGNERLHVHRRRQCVLFAEPSTQRTRDALLKKAGTEGMKPVP